MFRDAPMFRDASMSTVGAPSGAMPFQHNCEHRD
jgi:hypothetical protein